MSNDSSLKEVATDRGFRIGATLNAQSLRNDPSYWKTVRNEFNAITPENALKMGPLRPARNTYDFTDADAIVDFGRANDMYVRGHTLVWHNQLPNWFQAWEYTDEQLETFLRDHIHTVAGRYRATVDAWDVVNEAVADDGTLRETVWADAMGEKYLDRAFRWASEVTDATLYYNDYGADAVNEKSDSIYTLLSNLLERDVPIDGIGLQCHFLGDRPAPESIAENIRRFQELGLDVQITEMDVAFTAGDAPDDRCQEQAAYYRAIAEACLETGCDTLVQWGVNDANSWLRQFKDFPERYTDDPLLFDDNCDPKPAYHALTDTLIDG
ncbi:endo-1,4-beta-xylanase [Halocatena salina]|uniref:endo-1,4-beta-xylanase n=1 Tax=Halocatena salina TaxID=2934340 RepID=A0A8U0A4Q9_9EURY|nr:endo-1,4-beta-xylanase [Halocatena salina]UPM44201.1 endo-1,4-beta-xylanase [Halocatena salina]